MRRISVSLVSTGETIARICEVSAGLAIWGGAFLILLAIVARNIFNYGIAFAVDFTCYLTAWVCFVGAAYTQWVEGHISVTLISDRLPQTVRQRLNIATIVLSLLICLIFLYWSAVMLGSSIELRTHTMTAVRLPLAIPHSFQVIGFLMLSVVILVQVIAFLKKRYLAQADKSRPG